jgi:hypothetical protein
MLLTTTCFKVVNWRPFWREDPSKFLTDGKCLLFCSERLRPTTPRVATPPTTPTTTLISYKVHFQPQIVGKAIFFLHIEIYFTMERPLSSIRAPETDMSRPGFEPSTSCTIRGHTSKELSRHLMLFVIQEPLHGCTHEVHVAITHELIPEAHAGSNVG